MVYRAEKKMLRKELIRYIHDNEKDIGLECRIWILNMIAINGDNIHEEGTGCRILYSDLDNKILSTIYSEIKTDISANLINFNEID